jgi:hypothetical protein
MLVEIGFLLTFLGLGLGFGGGIVLGLGLSLGFGGGTFLPTGSTVPGFTEYHR